MKKLNVTTYGVVRMNQQEMGQLKGGTNDRPFGRPDYDQPSKNTEKDKKDEKVTDTDRSAWLWVALQILGR